MPRAEKAACAERDGKPKYPAAHREKQAFRHELAYELQPAGPERQANADLAMAVRSTSQQHARKIDAREQKGGSGDAHKHNTETGNWPAKILADETGARQMEWAISIQHIRVGASQLSADLVQVGFRLGARGSGL